MSLYVALNCLLIIGARICDISLGTVKMVAIIQGRQLFATVLGFIESLIFIVVVAGVLLNVRDEPVYAAAYAVGFAAGTYLGMWIEQRLALGVQLVSVFTRKGVDLVASLRAKGYRVTEVDGQGRDGPVRVLYIQVARRETERLMALVRELDPACFVVVNDVRTVSAAQRRIEARM